MPFQLMTFYTYDGFIGMWPYHKLRCICMFFFLEILWFLCLCFSLTQCLQRDDSKIFKSQIAHKDVFRIHEERRSSGCWNPTLCQVWRSGRIWRTREKEDHNSWRKGKWAEFIEVLLNRVLKIQWDDRRKAFSCLALGNTQKVHCYY